MEFFFLTQNNTIEILVLLFLVGGLILIWSHTFYLWGTRIWLIFRGAQKSGITHENPTPKVTETVIGSLPKDTSLIIEKITPEIITESKEIEKIDTSHVEKLTGFVSSVRTLIARGMTSEAQILIVEGLSLSKDHRELNLLLGQIYEGEGQYEKSEYIYKDLAELHPGDIEILEKLANVLIVEKKYQIANEIYKKIHSLAGNTETTLYMLTHISNTIGDTASTLEYAKQYILQWPKNPEIIALLATTQVEIGLRRDAIETYKILKNLTPYSHDITETLQKLLLEEELANNFEVKEG